MAGKNNCTERDEAEEDQPEDGVDEAGKVGPMRCGRRTMTPIPDKPVCKIGSDRSEDG